MVNLSSVSKWYLGHLKILEQINLELKRGDFLYVVGGSGAGKSTLLRMLATVEEPSTGSIKILGHSLSTVAETTLLRIRKKIGYIPQNFKLISDLSVYDNVTMSLFLSEGRLFPRRLENSVQIQINDLLEKLGLARIKNKPARTLSVGEAQRVAIARALIRSPELIVADEPTGAQDKDYTWLLMDLFLKANHNQATVVIATHDREIVRRVRKRCVLLRGGHLSFEEALCIY